ncbi:hypothetical protein HB770_24370 [Rhizobium leguminosarum bv. viciae]|uniref:Uncharacterized protein n=1 Tax=Rhizobium leguminosarum bv. viciae TaxID=387 RepID=A0A7G6RLN8_RHILV|nr:hypothetical protein HB770_24370 [Rhizobium leguminosarum bv. viciae]
MRSAKPLPDWREGPRQTLAAAEQEALAEGRKTRQERILPPLPFGVEFLDGALEGGLPLDAITEFRSALSRDAGAASGLAMAVAARLQKREADAEAGFCRCSGSAMPSARWRSVVPMPPGFGISG